MIPQLTPQQKDQVRLLIVSILFCMVLHGFGANVWGMLGGGPLLAVVLLWIGDHSKYW